MKNSVGALVNFIKRVLDFLNKHGTAIQTLVSVVGIIIAVIMVKSLGISRDQLAASTEPRLDIVCEIPVLDLGQIPVGTNYARDVPIPNAIITSNLSKTQLAALKAFNTNSSKMTFRNVGTVPISNVHLIARVEADFDDSGNVTNAIYESGLPKLTDGLMPGKNYTHDFGDDPAIGRMLAMSFPRRASHAVCYLIGYRRAIDMKLKTKTLYFEAMRVSPDSEPFAYAAGRSGLSYYPNNGPSPKAVRNGLNKCLEEIGLLPVAEDQ